MDGKLEQERLERLDRLHRRLLRWIKGHPVTSASSTSEVRDALVALQAALVEGR